MATSSVDATVKLWDLRNIKNKSSYIADLPHEKPVNSGKSLYMINKERRVRSNKSQLYSAN